MPPKKRARKTSEKSAPKRLSKPARKAARNAADSSEPFPKISHQKKRALLVAYAGTGNVRAAAHAAGVSRQAHYQWFANDAAYKEAFQEATEDAADVLEQVAWHRATVGWQDKPPSDTLLIFLLKGLRPQKYRERYDVRGEIAHEGQVHIHFRHELANGQVASAVELPDGQRVPLVNGMLPPGARPVA